MLTVRGAAEAVAFYARAFGAREIAPPVTAPSGQIVAKLAIDDQPYGMRQGRVADPYGHHWLIGKPL